MTLSNPSSGWFFLPSPGPRAGDGDPGSWAASCVATRLRLDNYRLWGGRWPDLTRMEGR